MNDVVMSFPEPHRRTAGLTLLQPALPADSKEAYGPMLTKMLNRPVTISEITRSEEHGVTVQFSFPVGDSSGRADWSGFTLMTITHISTETGTVSGLITGDDLSKQDGFWDWLAGTEL